MGESGFGIAQLGAAAVGVVYLAAGVIGFFITGFGSFVGNATDSLLSFDINPFHNLFHLLVGVYLLIVTGLNRTAAEGALIGGGLVYLVAAFLGFDNHLQILSINSATASDNFLHIVSGGSALLIGIISVSLNRTKRSRNAVQQS